MRRFDFVPSRSTGREIERLSREFDLTEGEVVEQLVELGLEEVNGSSTEAASDASPSRGP